MISSGNIKNFDAGDLIVEGKSFIKQQQRPNASPRGQPGSNSSRYSSAYVNSHELSEQEKVEAYDYPMLYYTGQNNRNKRDSVGGYDDSRGDYIISKGDHISFRYEIMDILGKGSFGQVVHCKDHATGQMVAVKIIRNKKRFHQQALIEVKILERLKLADQHDTHSIIKIETSFYFRNHLCIVFPLLSINLYEFIKQNNFSGFSLSLIRRISCQIIDCLTLLSRLDIIHCDLKPENILLVSPTKSNIKVIDFGSSCYSNDRIYTYIQSRFYRSPEIILGLEYGPPIDMWSLGCILVELFTGYPIFPAKNEQELMSCFLEVLGEPPRELIEMASRRKIFFHQNGSPKIVPDSNGKIRGIGTKSLEQIMRPIYGIDTTYRHFIDFVKRCLVWDPSKRMTPFEAKQHPFLSIEGSLASMNLSSPKKTYFPSMGTGRIVSNSGTIGDKYSYPSAHKKLPDPKGMLGGPSTDGPRQRPYKTRQVTANQNHESSTSWSSILNAGFSKFVTGIKSLGSSRENLDYTPTANDSLLESVKVDEFEKRPRRSARRN